MLLLCNFKLLRRIRTGVKPDIPIINYQVKLWIKICLSFAVHCVDGDVDIWMQSCVQNVYLNENKYDSKLTKVF